MITTQHVRRWISIIGRGIKIVSPTTAADAVGMLTERADRHEQWLTANADRVPEVIDFLCNGANEIEAAEKVKYNAAVVRAKLPPQVSGEVYIRGWRQIHEYDCRRGSIEAWLGGFIPRVYKEDKRQPSRWRPYDTQEGPVAIADLSAPDPAAEMLSDEEFEATFHEIFNIYLAGHAWVEHAHDELRLINLWQTALIQEWAKLNAKQRAVIKNVICEDIDRSTVAQMYGFKDRNGVDQVVRRYAKNSQDLAARLRQEAEKRKRR